MPNPIAIETAWTIPGALIPMWVSIGRIRLATYGSPIQPSARLARVIPSCVAERYASKCEVRRRASATLLSASSIASSCVDRTLTSANSEATKNPFRKTRNRITSKLKTTEVGEAKCSFASPTAASKNGISIIIDSIASDDGLEVRATSRRHQTRGQSSPKSDTGQTKTAYEPATPATLLTTVDEASRTGIPRELRKTFVVAFRLQFSTNRGILLHCLQLPLIPFNPRPLRHSRLRR